MPYGHYIPNKKSHRRVSRNSSSRRYRYWVWIMAKRLAGSNVALALLANTLATGAILVALIFTFGGISGAHFNPAVTVADALERGIPWREVPAYVGAQCLGGLTGTIVAHLMFGLPIISLSHHARSGSAQIFSEFIATFGFLLVIWGCSRAEPTACR